MKIQYVGKTSRQFESKHEITYSQLNKPNSLDVFDVNVFSLQDSLLFRCETGAKESLDCTNDLRSIREMIHESNSAINIVVLPQNYNHITYCNSSVYKSNRMLKDEIDNLVKNILYGIIPAAISQSYSLIYENSETKLFGSTFESSFCFKQLSSDVEVLSESTGGSKPTTIQKDRIILTTLNLLEDNAKFDDFIKGIGLDNEKVEIPEWLAELNYFDDSIQKASITDSEAKIVELNEQIVVSNEKIKENLKYKSILVSSGNDLVEVVFEMLEKMLCYDLSKFIDEKREDFVIQKDGVAFVGEIKGVNSNVKYGNVSQTETHCKNYMDVLESENRNSNIKGVLIINTFRKTPLDKREPVNQEQIDLAKKYNILIITTETFLKLYEMFIDDDINGESIEDILKTKIGLLEVSDFASSSNGMVDNSAYTI